MAKVVDLNREDMKVLEGYIKNVDKLRLRLKVRKLEILDNPIIDNPGSGKPNLPSSPVEREIMMCLKDTYYNNLEKIIKAIDIVYENADDEVKEVMKLKYWEPKLGIETWEDIGKELGYSKTSILRVRKSYLKDIANRIDYINSDF